MSEKTDRQQWAAGQGMPHEQADKRDESGNVPMRRSVIQADPLIAGDLTNAPTSNNRTVELAPGLWRVLVSDDPKGPICYRRMYESDSTPSHSAYCRKLAEAIDDALPSGEEIIEIDPDGNVSKPRIAAIAAILASEGCVDPEALSLQVKRANKAWSKVERLSKDLKSAADESADRMMIAHDRFKQLAALREEHEKLKKILGPDRNPLAFHNGERHGMERAAKIAHEKSLEITVLKNAGDYGPEDVGDEIVAAIQADKERTDA